MVIEISAEGATSLGEAIMGNHTLLNYSGPDDDDDPRIQNALQRNRELAEVEDFRKMDPKEERPGIIEEHPGIKAGFRV